MRKYLSYGGGVNSTAMILLLLDEGWGFESVYVDHGCDWPETREYVQMMQDKGYPITVLKPSVGYRGQDFDNIYDWGFVQGILPSRLHRWCTQRFKVEPILDYVLTPCFQLIGIDTSEAHRAKLSCNVGIENRFPLLEYEIDRKGCEEIIKAHGLPVPMKSGCYICPFQQVRQWRLLRRVHPDLFCKAKKLEDRVNEPRLAKGYKPFYINKSPLDSIVNEKQSVMWPDMKPPCSCGL